MIKPFDTLYSNLEKALKQDSKTHPGAERYLHGMDLIRECIGQVRAQGAKLIRVEANEIVFFRDVWPVFHSELFLYIWLYEIEMRRLVATVGDWAAIMREEEERVASFFRSNRKFWFYYRAGARGLDNQFTRAYNQSRILDPFITVMDQEGATQASYRAAWCLAMHRYGEWLREERGLLSAGTISAADLGYSWAASDADLIEWLYGLQAVGAVQFQGQPADIGRLEKWAGMAVGRRISNIYNRGKVLRNRKKERLAFSKKTAYALEKKWDRADGKFE